jgi:hypothetical protein
VSAVRPIRIILIALGWIIALFMAATPILLARDYGFDGIGWGVPLSVHPSDTDADRNALDSETSQLETCRG